MRKWIDLMEEVTKTSEDLGSRTLPLTFTRTVDPHSYKSSGSKGLVPCTKIRANLMLGKLMIGGYETVEGSTKVKVYVGGQSYATVASEEAAKQLLLNQI